MTARKVNTRQAQIMRSALGLAPDAHAHLDTHRNRFSPGPGDKRECQDLVAQGLMGARSLQNGMDPSFFVTALGVEALNAQRSRPAGVEIPDAWCRDLLTTAAESKAIAYWLVRDDAGDVCSEVVRDSDGLVVKILGLRIDRYDASVRGLSPETVDVGLADVRRGIERMLTVAFTDASRARVYLKSLGNADAYAADLVIQHAVFGAVVFG